MPDHPLRAAQGVFLALMAAELLYRWLSRPGNGRVLYDWRETAASLAIAIGNRAIAASTGGTALAALMWLYPYRLFDVDPRSPWALLGLFVLVDLAYYVHHRAMHGIRLLWATHSVHHSATVLNLSAAVRLGWGGRMLGLVFYLPLVLLGFHPLAVLGLLGLNLAFQFFLHASWAPSLGVLGAVLNTPRHHHVHHACNPTCLDRNFGGVFIVFDRLFGTFAAPPAEPLRFGLGAAHPPSHNPLRILTREWLAMAGDVRRARGLRARLSALIRIP